jgi:hypothetical protein
MMQVRGRPRILEAIKYNGMNDEEIISSISEWLSEDKIVSRKPIIINTETGAVKLQFGGWVLFDSADIFVESPSTFFKNYSIIEEWD